MNLDTDGKIFDIDDQDLSSESSSVPNFGKQSNNNNKDSVDADVSYTDLSEMFDQARKKARRTTVSIGGRNDLPFLLNKSW
jgi:hypothetical protein